jgi:hypothetical protein
LPFRRQSSRLSRRAHFPSTLSAQAFQKFVNSPISSFLLFQ